MVAPPCHRRKRHRCNDADGQCMLMPAEHGSTCRRATACARATARDCQTGRVAGCTWRRWNRRSRRLGCYDDGRNPTTHNNNNHNLLTPPRRFVSYSLFWGPARGAGYRGQCHSLAEYAYGLWKSVGVALARRWGVLVYHDGSVEPVLARFRQAFPSSSWGGAVRFVRVDVAPALRGRRYLGCLFRLLAADDPTVDVFLCRDLDDPLDPKGLDVVERRFLPVPRLRAHYQSERYDTPHHTHMANLGWYGQKNDHHRQSRAMHDAIVRFVSGGRNDHYTADEEFLTHHWLRRQPASAVARLPSHPYRRAPPPPSARRRIAAWRAFWHGRRPSAHTAAAQAATDAVVRLGH